MLGEATAADPAVDARARTALPGIALPENGAAGTVPGGTASPWAPAASFPAGTGKTVIARARIARLRIAPGLIARPRIAPGLIARLLIALLRIALGLIGRLRIARARIERGERGRGVIGHS